MHGMMSGAHCAKKSVVARKSSRRRDYTVGWHIAEGEIF